MIRTAARRTAPPTVTTTCAAYVLLDIAHQFQHDVPAPPMDAASTRTLTSGPWASCHTYVAVAFAAWECWML
jgi:hypothetical protein